MIEDLLMASRIEGGELKMDWKTYRLDDVLQGVLDQMEPSRLAKEIVFDVDISPDIQLQGDDMRIAQVIRILIDNAIKYSDNRSRVEIKAVDRYQGEYNTLDIDGVLIQIKDHGKGISEKDLSRVFERFFRTDEVKNITGTGLGLNIARELTLLHQGDIFAWSEHGKGSSFSVFLPRLEKPLRNNQKV